MKLYWRDSYFPSWNGSPFFGTFWSSRKHVHRPPPTCAPNCSLFHLPWRILISIGKSRWYFNPHRDFTLQKHLQYLLLDFLLDGETSPKENAIQTAKSTKSEDRLGEFWSNSPKLGKVDSCKRERYQITSKLIYHTRKKNRKHHEIEKCQLIILRGYMVALFPLRFVRFLRNMFTSSSVS